ncbi:MAG: ribonuclease H-like domain-containing protein [Reyranella sp.]|uniref:ribonuclease H-like domain-containing protein n=1 Tax=Reyranella sp. TaxID=1929291 RepID=UPI003D12B309
MHRIVCIGALYAERDAEGPFDVRAIGARHIGEKDERNLVDSFLDSLPGYDRGMGPVLVSFNGGGFDLPVLRYRAMALGVTAPALFGRYGRDYWYRYGRDHFDLCDLVSGFGASSRPSLNEMAALLDVPSKLQGMEGSQVEAFVQAGRLDDVASYCLGDVITTFRLLLRFALVRGELDARTLGESEASLDLAVERLAKQRPILQAMLRSA